MYYLQSLLFGLGAHQAGGRTALCVCASVCLRPDLLARFIHVVSRDDLDYEPISSIRTPLHLSSESSGGWGPTAVALPLVHAKLRIDIYFSCFLTEILPKRFDCRTLSWPFPISHRYGFSGQPGGIRQYQHVMVCTQAACWSLVCDTTTTSAQTCYG